MKIQVWKSWQKLCALFVALASLAEIPLQSIACKCVGCDMLKVHFILVELHIVCSSSTPRNPVEKFRFVFSQLRMRLLRVAFLEKLVEQKAFGWHFFLNMMIIDLKLEWSDNLIGFSPCRDGGAALDSVIQKERTTIEYLLVSLLTRSPLPATFVFLKMGFGQFQNVLWKYAIMPAAVVSDNQ